QLSVCQKWVTRISLRHNELPMPSARAESTHKPALGCWTARRYSVEYDRLLISGSRFDSESAHSSVQVNLLAGCADGDTLVTPFVRSADRTRVMLLLNSCCYIVDGQVYTAPSDAFISQGPLFYYGAGASISADRTG